MFAPFLEALGSGVDCVRLSLPVTGPQTAAALATLLRQQLPDRPFVVLAESFAGAIALQIAAQPSPRLLGVILVASFLAPPRPQLLRLAAPFVRIVWSMRRVLAPLWWPLCGYRRQTNLRHQLLKVLDTLPWPTVWARLQAMRQIELHTGPLVCPVAIFHAGNDCLLPSTLRTAFTGIGAQVVVPGPHFLLQSEPVAMAAHVRRCFAEFIRPVSKPA